MRVVCLNLPYTPDYRPTASTELMSFMNKFFGYCYNGKVHLESLYTYSAELKNLLVGRDTTSINFQQNIRSYISVITFASMGAKLTLPLGYNPSFFRIYGQVFQSSVSLYPSVRMIPVFNQL